MIQRAVRIFDANTLQRLAFDSVGYQIQSIRLRHRSHDGRFRDSLNHRGILFEFNSGFRETLQ